MPTSRPAVATKAAKGPNEMGPNLNDWVVLDFETASVRGTPCQVAALRIRAGIEIDAFSTFIFQSPDDFDGFNVSLHGINPQMVSGAPPWPEVATRLLEFADGAPFVAHYAPFDMGVIRDAYDRSGLEWPRVQYTCTVSISRMVWPGLSSYSLPLLCAELGIPINRERHHEALYDARLAAEILQRAITVKGASALYDLLERIWIRFGEISPDGWYGSDARLRSAAGLPETAADADPDSPLYGKFVVFTGELAMIRRAAWQLVAEAGGHPEANVTRETSMLVCGYQDIVKLAAGETKSGKLRRAEKLHAAGQPLEILTERDFFRLLGGSEGPRQ